MIYHMFIYIYNYIDDISCLYICTIILIIYHIIYMYIDNISYVPLFIADSLVLTLYCTYPVYTRITETYCKVQCG